MVDLILEPRTPELEQRMREQYFGTVAEGRGWNATIAENPLPLRIDKVSTTATTSG